VVGGDGELSGPDEVAEELLDAAAAEAGPALEGGLVGDPLAARVGVAGDGEQDHQVRTRLAGVVEDGGEVFMAHRRKLLG
jgi:hypothetical protein